MLSPSSTAACHFFFARPYPTRAEHDVGRYRQCAIVYFRFLTTARKLLSTNWSTSWSTLSDGCDSWNSEIKTIDRTSSNAIAHMTTLSVSLLLQSIDCEVVTNSQFAINRYSQLKCDLRNYSTSSWWWIWIGLVVNEGECYTKQHMHVEHTQRST